MQPDFPEEKKAFHKVQKGLFVKGIKDNWHPDKRHVTVHLRVSILTQDIC